MSEEERRQRLGYRKIRKKRITAGTVILVALLILTLAASVLTVMLNNTYYVNYSETSKVDWGVHLKENEFYEESFLGKDYAYIASLIDKVEARFDYGMTVESEKAVDFDYTYRVDAVVEIRDIYIAASCYTPPSTTRLPRWKRLSAERELTSDRRLSSTMPSITGLPRGLSTYIISIAPRRASF